MEPAKRKGRPGDQEPEAAGPPADKAPERADDPPARRKAGKKADQPKVKKVKMTLSLTEKTSSRLNVSAAILNVAVSDLVEALLGPLLKGYSAPTIPEGLTALFGKDPAPES